ncbi:hypothetical protein AJ80_06806 [Polytolypa hystricis UAMH7299]|uniref:Uncharacterized protein n=1 Tax=Polytolypa hystricis (strain UAMH7299) TaxID=1447883 RepID=A0A2B7XSJ4_POLH7|nr:hypothetical protein AJ80_06806 [Polytolypa hystricis UAMH7299]
MPGDALEDACRRYAAVTSNSFWDQLLDMCLGKGLADRLHLSKLEKAHQASVEAMRQEEEEDEETQSNTQSATSTTASSLSSVGACERGDSNATSLSIGEFVEPTKTTADTASLQEQNGVAEAVVPANQVDDDDDDGGVGVGSPTWFETACNLLAEEDTATISPHAPPFVKQHDHLAGYQASHAARREPESRLAQPTPNSRNEVFETKGDTTQGCESNHTGDKYSRRSITFAQGHPNSGDAGGDAKSTRNDESRRTPTRPRFYANLSPIDNCAIESYSPSLPHDSGYRRGVLKNDGVGRNVPGQDTKSTSAEPVAHASHAIANRTRSEPLEVGAAAQQRPPFRPANTESRLETFLKTQHFEAVRQYCVDKWAAEHRARVDSAIGHGRQRRPIPLATRRVITQPTQHPGSPLAAGEVRDRNDSPRVESQGLVRRTPTDNQRDQADNWVAAQRVKIDSTVNYNRQRPPIPVATKPATAQPTQRPELPPATGQPQVRSRENVRGIPNDIRRVRQPIIQLGFPGKPDDKTNRHAVWAFPIAARPAPPLWNLGEDYSVEDIRRFIAARLTYRDQTAKGYEPQPAATSALIDLRARCTQLRPHGAEVAKADDIEAHYWRDPATAGAWIEHYTKLATGSQKPIGDSRDLQDEYGVELDFVEQCAAEFAGKYHHLTEQPQRYPSPPIYADAKGKKMDEVDKNKIPPTEVVIDKLDPIVPLELPDAEFGRTKMPIRIPGVADILVLRAWEYMPYQLECD